MDYHALQTKLFNLDPSDPREDLAKLQAQAQGGAVGDVPPTKDYVNESYEAQKGSMPLGINSITDFAALAGVRVDEKQKKADYAKGSDSMPKAQPGRTKHPLKDKLVGEDDKDSKIAELEERIERLESLLAESGLQRYTGIKKYGKKGFEELQKAGREGANEKEKGAIKDKYLKKESTVDSIKDELYKRLNSKSS